MAGDEDDFHKDPVEGLPLDLHKTVDKFSDFQISKSYFVVVLLLQLQLAVHRAGGVEDLEEGAGGEYVDDQESKDLSEAGALEDAEKGGTDAVTEDAADVAVNSHLDKIDRVKLFLRLMLMLIVCW